MAQGKNKRASLQHALQRCWFSSGWPAVLSARGADAVGRMNADASLHLDCHDAAGLSKGKKGGKKKA